jgi:hypothetical protein
MKSARSLYKARERSAIACWATAENADDKRWWGVIGKGFFSGI